MPQKITPEMIEALAWMRMYARFGPPGAQVVQAIKLLDSADFFTSIDAADTKENDAESL